jgi:hypothetical protein
MSSYNICIYGNVTVNAIICIVNVLIIIKRRGSQNTSTMSLSLQKFKYVISAER